jgi:putative tricarboxylic transport membrane protein
LRKADILCSIFLISIGLVFCIGAFGVGIGTVLQPGPGLMPIGAAVLLILFSLGTIGEALITISTGDIPAPPAKRWGMVIVVLVMLFAYACLLDFLGFLLSTFILLTLLFKLSEGQTWKVALAESTATTGLTYLLFDYLLRCNFPRGLLEFTGL